jgi:hypothetical protein
LLHGLSFTRTALLLKRERLDDAGPKSHPVPTSRLPLHGLVRHMAEVERNWIYVHMIEEYARHNGHAD